MIKSPGSEFYKLGRKKTPNKIFILYRPPPAKRSQKDLGTGSPEHVAWRIPFTAINIR